MVSAPPQWGLGSPRLGSMFYDRAGLFQMCPDLAMVRAGLKESGA